MDKPLPFDWFAHPQGEWLKGTGPDSDVVVSTRVRLARNIRGYPFTGRATPAQRADILKITMEALRAAHLNRSVVGLELDRLQETDRDVLVERHLISRELAGGDGPRGVVFGRGEMLSVMINEEDHLRLQWLKSGFDVDRAFGALRRVDQALEQVLPFAFSDRYGYLTACPTNVGTGMRVSVMVHLPALTMKDHIEKVFKAAQRMNHAVRGLYGEGTRAFGDMYQLSNQATLGRSEEELVANVKAIVPKVLEYERRMRGTIYTEERAFLEDKVQRSLAVLRSARRLSVQEMMSHLSMVRLGIDLRLVGDVSLETVNRLFILGQPSHLQREAGSSLNPAERDARRAEMVRAALAAGSN
ncbi:MAG: protein arginine kinase [Planctomycetes bacterium]|nr:protein arginine kinase [Planctomycetota bacterium]